MRVALGVVFAYADRLQSLHYAIDYNAIVALDRGDDATLLWLSRVSLPCLICVEYDGGSIFPPTMLDRVTLPWGQITVLDLRLRWASWQNVARLLAVTAQVQILLVSKDRSGLGNYCRPLSRAVIILPFLSTEVMVMDPSDIICLLGTIKAPRLTRLDLCASSSSRKPYGHGPADSTPAQALGNVANACSTLTCVAIINLDLPYDTLRSILNALASLEQLTLRYRREALYGGQGPYPDASNLLELWATSPVSPNLRRLSLMAHTWDHAPAGSLLQLCSLTLDLWKTGGWIILDHFEITLEAFGIKDAFDYPHVRLRNGAIQGYEWDARIPVAGDHLDIYPVPQQSPDAVVTLFITVEDELGQADALHTMVPITSRPGAWVFLNDHASIILQGSHVYDLERRLLRQVPENGTFVPCIWEEPIAVASGDHLRLSWKQPLPSRVVNF
ncbi:hypothetical protein EV122DRAFT_285073 [Schizophyllum commune]